MKKTLLAIALLSTIGVAQADYSIKIPTGEGQGGFINESSLIITKYLPIAPLLSSWANTGAITGCTWTPNASTITKGTQFTQTANDCKQTQTQTSQAREQDAYSSTIRNVGAPTTKTQVVTVSSTQTATGTKTKVPVCVMGGSANQGYWIVKGGSTRVLWYSTSPSNAEYVDVYIPSSQTSYTKGDYTFTAGTYASLESVGTIYYICRE